MAPLDQFRPGEEGFGARLLAPRATYLAGSAWTVALIVAVILMVCAFVRLTQHQPRALELRPTLHPASPAVYVPAETRRDRGFAKLEMPEDAGR